MNYFVYGGMKISLDDLLDTRPYKVYNHNHVLLGQFATSDEAHREANFYIDQTGNSAHVRKVS